MTFAGYRVPEPDFACRIPDSEICFPYTGRHLQTVYMIRMKFGPIVQWGTWLIVAKFRPNLACRLSAITEGRSLDGWPAVAGFVSGSVHPQPFRNGLTDSSQIWQTTVNLSSADTDHNISSWSAGPFTSDCCWSSLTIQVAGTGSRATSCVVRMLFANTIRYPHEILQENAAWRLLGIFQISSQSDEPFRNGNRRTEPCTGYSGPAVWAQLVCDSRRTLQ